MRLAIDTNRYVDFARGVPEVVKAVETAEAVLVPFVVLAELRAGFLSGTRCEANEKILTQFLGRPGILALYPDHETTRHYSRLFLQLRRQGTPIPTNDLWIASLVVQHSLALYARDKHFDLLPQLPRKQ
jgi:tRNA(fMet)-specific endonuclease VapC